MALRRRTQAAWWGLAGAALLLLLWLLGGAVLPFVLAGAIAYVLDPVADRLQKLGLRRSAAVVVITLVGLVFFAALMLVVVPALVEQVLQLVNAAPRMFQNLQGFLADRFPQVIDEGSPMRKALEGLGETVRDRGVSLVEGLLASAANLFGLVVLLVLVPVLTFYLLMDWDRMVTRIDALLPRDHAPTIRRLAREIDDTLAGFIRGQGTVCAILGTYYAVALMAMGLQFGLVIGVFAGVITFIPYVGAVLGGAAAIGVALFQFWGQWWWILAVAVVFQAGQLVEGNILTPKLVGSSVGLHPVWLIFALSAFGALFGFVGLLIAVPVAAALGVLARFLVERYKESGLYTGVAPDDRET